MKTTPRDAVLRTRPERWSAEARGSNPAHWWRQPEALLTAALFMAGGQHSAAAEAVRPDLRTIERHRDVGIQVFGSYASVKLPIRQGVPIWNPTAIKLAPDGVMFAANYVGEIYRLLDTDGDGLEDSARLFADVRHDGLRYPTSLAFRGNEVFVGTAQQVRVYVDANGDGLADQSRSFLEGIPLSGHTFDWTFGLNFGPDGWLYLALCTDSYNPTPAADPLGWRGSILRASPDGKAVERFATGLRFPFGMAFNPAGDLFFSDNRGGDNPTEEINFAQRGRFYGQHPEKFPGHPPVTPPVVQVQHGYGMAGLAFNSPSNDFGGTASDLFAACWGPDWLWERGSIIRVRLTKQPDGGYRAVESLFAREVPKVSDVAFGPQGDLYAAQFGQETVGHQPFSKPTGGFYRFIAVPGIKPAKPETRYPVLAGNRVQGRALFTARGCATCHALDPSRQLLGPDLTGIGDMFTEEEILAFIRKPSEGIKSGYETEQVTLRGGETIQGRIVTADATGLTLLGPGNLPLRLARDQIVAHQSLPTSMMPEGLLDGMSESEITDLLSYLGVRDRRPGLWQRSYRTAYGWLHQLMSQVSMKVMATVIAGSGLLLVAGLRLRLRRDGKRRQLGYKCSPD